MFSQSIELCRAHSKCSFVHPSGCAGAVFGVAPGSEMSQEAGPDLHTKTYLYIRGSGMYIHVSTLIITDGGCDLLAFS